MTPEQIAKLRAFIADRAKAYVAGVSYDDTAFTTAMAAEAIGAQDAYAVNDALAYLETEGFVEWFWPSRMPGYWWPTSKARMEKAQ